MAVKILIPTPLRPYAGNNADVAVEAGTVDEALAQLMSQFPDLKKHLYNEAGALRNFVNVYVNEEDIRYLDRGNTSLKDGQVVSIVPSVAGGSAVVTSPAEDVELSHEEIRRYSRHLIMPEVALEGQKKLKAARVLMIGTGGLGSPLGLYLGAAGVGHLGLVDFDVVDESNLQRQIIQSTQDVGRSKLDSARDRLAAMNPHVQVETYNTRLSSANALDLFADYDIVVDGTDNFPTRYLVNDACALLGKPNVYGSIFRFEGQASVFYAKEGPCYRCLYPEPPPPGLVPSCAEGGVLGILPGLVGVIQATETIKLILGQGEPLIGRLLLVNALGMKFRELKLRKNPECPVCSENATIKELIDYEQFCGIEPEPVAVQDQAWEITPRECKERLDRGEQIFLLDVREPQEWEICRLNGATLIPLGQLPKRMHELNSADDIVVYCRSGARSANAYHLLHNAGFRRIKNLKGGTLAWSDQVDPTMPKY